jgi:transposase
MRPDEDVELEELLAANHDLFVVYVLRDALKTYGATATRAMPPGPGAAGTARRCGAASSRCAGSRGTCGLTCPASSPTAAGRLAPTWSRASTIRSRKRMAYGFRDDAYFFLKIRAAFPGVGR